MARGLRLSPWLALSALLAAGALAGWWLPSPWLDWQPDLVWQQPWRAWTAAFVHWSPLHLGANLLGLALVAALGEVGRLPPRAALAWGLAWPLTQGALLLQPALRHYGGLSGVLHAGVAVAVVVLLQQERGPRRIVAGLIGAGLVAKVLLEAPWGPPLRQLPGWDIAIAPLAHASGLLAGALLAGLLRQRQSMA